MPVIGGVKGPLISKVVLFGTRGEGDDGKHRERDASEYGFQRFVFHVFLLLFIAYPTHL